MGPYGPGRVKPGRFQPGQARPGQAGPGSAGQMNNRHLLFINRLPKIYNYYKYR